MSASWPEEALRAQAVAARTYVLHEAARRTGRDWDVSATAVSQVYRGISAETDETRGDENTLCIETTQQIAKPFSFFTN